MALSKLEEKTHNFRNTIISFKSEIRATDVETYLKRHLSEFYKNSRFIVLCGVHTSPTGELAQSESKFVADYQSMFDNIISDHENPCRKKCNTCRECLKFLLWEEKRFLMGTVLPIFSKLNHDGKYVLLKSSINTIKWLFEELLNTSWPHVFIFATCFSQYSEINHLLRSHGLYSVLSLSKERGDITSGHFFQLDNEQKSFLEKVVGDLTIKDIIITGECNVWWVSLFLKNLLVVLIIRF